VTVRNRITARLFPDVRAQIERRTGSTRNHIGERQTRRPDRGLVIEIARDVETLRDPNGGERATIRMVSEVPVPVCWG
jgi:hypothetical protein